MEFIISCSNSAVVKEPEENRIDLLKEKFAAKDFSFQIPAGSKIDTVVVDENKKEIIITANQSFSNRAFRDEEIPLIYSEIRNFLGAEYYNYTIKIYTLGFPIEQLVPNFYRKNKNFIDVDRIAQKKNIKAVVTNLNRGFDISKGLSGRHIALWHSHGWYYNHQRKRWMWQRARLFTAVEDLGPFTFTVPYLIPMLENAGANVFVPRERDTQTEEVIIDNDGSIGGKIKIKGNWKKIDTTGFAIGNPPYANNLNPFLQGSFLETTANNIEDASISYIPNFKKGGEYSVYISYKHSEKNSSDVKYKVYHTGGVSEFSINQQIGGETWIYLGTFKFAEGENPGKGKVVLTNAGKESGYVTADAVRFGGGMGVVERDGTTSGRPKFAEGARYWLQYAGMPDTLVYDFNNNIKDYNDDYQCRGEWVDYLKGAPFGPNKNRNAKGLGIPIDLSLAFHTDAGLTTDETVIGTLLIYSLHGAENEIIFPDSVSRLASRDFSDIMQTEIVDNLRAKYDSVWSKRQLREAGYSEAYRLNVPAALLELLSHENLQDVKFMNDPQFRFDVSRAIYKSMLKFLSAQNNFDYVVQPLPVSHFATELSPNGTVTLTWLPTEDLLEPTAIPGKYKVYTRIDSAGFDNGVVVKGTSYTIKNIKPNKIYSFKITAINKGGESFPSEILSVCWNGKNEFPVLIVNGFDRISAPAVIESDNFSGFLGVIDEGVPDKYDIGFVGDQYNFNPKSKWETDDVPGHGASFANMESKIFMGNTFDFTYLHGVSIAEAGFSFTSVSDEAIEDSNVLLDNYKMVDLIYGEEKTTHWQTRYADSVNGIKYKVFPRKMKKVVTSYLNNGGNLFVSGSYIASDLYLWKDKESADVKFCNDILKYTFQSDHAVKTGKVYPVSNIFDYKSSFEFNTEYCMDYYKVEAPDAIKGINGGRTILRYAENNYSAAVAYKDKYGVIAFGFPFETIKSGSARNNLMKSIFEFFELKKGNN